MGEPSDQRRGPCEVTTRVSEDELRRLRSVREGRLLCGPETLQLNLGTACNLDCAFCWNHSPLVPPRPKSWHDQRLSDPHLEDVVNALPLLRPGRVLLSGRGEPLLHPRVVPLLETLRAHRVPVTIQTNGIGGLTPEQIRDLGVDHLTVNVSAGTARGYETTHPGRGHLFGRVVARLRRLAELRGSSPTPRVTLVAVIQKTNQDEIVPLTELAAEVGAEGLHLKGLELVPGLEPLRLDHAARGAVLDRVAVARELSGRLGLRLQVEHLAQVVGASSRRGRFTESLARGPCFMGWYYLRVTCDGRVMFCCKDKLMGHLDRRRLYQIWRSAPYHLQRLAGRDGDPGTGLFNAKCRACSNFARNREVGALLRQA